MVRTRWRRAAVAAGALVLAWLVWLGPMLRMSRAQHDYRECRGIQKQIGTALEMYSTDASGRYPLGLGPLVPNYLREIPVCPATGRDTYSAGYASASNPDAYTVVCAGLNHAQVDCDANYPQYNSVQGLIEEGGSHVPDASVSYLSSPSSYRSDAPVRGGLGAPPAPEGFDSERYDRLVANEIVRTAEHPLSTFSIDVDTASYANVRRFLREGRKPPPDAVRVEEMVNYFSYGYPAPEGPEPFSVTAGLAECPWDPQNRLLAVGLQARKLDLADAPPCNLVFLVDVSGSMQDASKLPLVKQGLKMLAGNLRPEDRIALAVYAGSSGLVLDSTPGDRRQEVVEALDRLESGGSTNGAQGLRLAYQVARKHRVPGGVNRVVLATDGDFNVGVTSHGELIRLIEEERADGIELTALGFGTGNYNDHTLEKLADHGNGNYAYVDTPEEARKVLVHEVGATLVTVAADVKIQVEFNPARVAAWRLIGYENRLLEDRDFKDDRKDAGEIGAGHSVTALYELVPAATPELAPLLEPLRYQTGRTLSERASGDEAATARIRYKASGSTKSRELVFPVLDRPQALEEAPEDLRFATAVALFALSLRPGDYLPEPRWDDAERLARSALGADPEGRRREMLELIERARDL